MKIFACLIELPTITGFRLKLLNLMNLTDASFGAGAAYPSGAHKTQIPHLYLSL